MSFKERIIKLLRWSEKYTKTDMVYLAKGGFWQTFNRGMTFLIGFATMSVLSRGLIKETYGAYQYVLSIMGILGLTTLPAMGNALIRAVSKKREGMLAKATKKRFKWSVLGIIGSLLVAGWYLWQGNTVLGYSFLMTSFLFPLPRIFNNYSPFWMGRKRFDVNARHTVLINLMEALLFLPVIYFTDKLLLILGAYLVSRSIFRGIALKYALSKTENNKQDEETISYGKHLTAIQIINTIGGKIDKIFIWQLLGPAQVAIYSFAQLPVTKLKGIIPISALSLPKLSEKEEIVTGNLLKKFFKMFLLTIPLALIAFFVMPYFYQIAFPDYSESIAYARALTFIIALAPFAFLQTTLLAEMKKRELYIIRIATPLLKIALFIILIPLYQVWGVIIATIASQLINGGLVFYFFKTS